MKVEVIRQEVLAVAEASSRKVDASSLMNKFFIYRPISLTEKPLPAPHRVGSRDGSSTLPSGTIILNNSLKFAPNKHNFVSGSGYL